MNKPQGFVFGLEKFGGFEIFEGHYFSLLFQLVLKTKFTNFGNSFMIMKIYLNALYHKKGLLRLCFLMWFVSVCAQWLSFTLNREHACKQRFLVECLCLSNEWVSLFKLCRENMNDVFGFLNSSSGLGEGPTLFEAWCLGIRGWFHHQWLIKCSMCHDQPILSDQWGPSLGCNTALRLIGYLKWRISGSKLSHMGDYLA